MGRRTPRGARRSHLRPAAGRSGGARGLPGDPGAEGLTARFSELFRRVRTQGPQRVVKQGGEAVVVVATEEFDRTTRRAHQPASLVEFLGSAPTGGRRLDLARKRDTTKTIKW